AFFVPLGSGIAWVTTRRGWPIWVAGWWVAVEAVRGDWPFSGMPFGRLVYATADTPWAEALPWIGMTGVSLLVALSGTGLAWALVTLRAEPRRVAAYGALLAVATALPVVVTYDVAADGTATVAAVQSDVPGSGTDVVGVHREVTQNHVEATVELAAAVEEGTTPRPDLVLWSENSTAVDP